MSERENLQPEQEVESQTAVENSAGQTLEEATQAPGDRIEQTQDFTQAEAVEAVLIEAVEAAATAENEAVSGHKPDSSSERPGTQAGGEIEISDQNSGDQSESFRDVFSVTESKGAEDQDGSREVRVATPPIEPGSPTQMSTVEVPTGIEIFLVSGADGGQNRSGNEVSPIPVPLPAPETEEVGVQRTPVQVAEPDLGEPLPNSVAEEPEPGPDPFMGPVDESILVDETLADGVEVVADGVENLAKSEEIPGEAPKESDGSEGDESSEGSESGEVPKWYLHEDENGKVTVVDENGKPVDSPPHLVYYNGKYYAVYGDDELPIKSDGTVDDPNKLAKYEVSDYHGSTQEMYIHADDDGNITVVDADGKPVDSPPTVVEYQGKKYLVYPGDNPINPDGTVNDPSKLITAEQYKSSTEGMYLHEDENGNVTVVDEHGKPVDTPPTVVEYQGKKYLVYPGENLVKPDGTVDDPSKLVGAEYYKTSTQGMYFYADENGTVTVVDEHGNLVDSPPAIVTYQGKQYAYYPGENPINPDGSVSDPSKLVSLETYQSSPKDVYFHEDANGKVTVVDVNGNPVSSPPKVYEYQGKYYVSGTGESPFAQDGKLNDPSKLIEVQNYKTDTAGMYLHEGQDGQLTVVDENGKPVNSPPNVFQYQGKYYAAYPGDNPIGSDGKLKDPNKLVEIKNYQPSWWNKKAAS
jgi:hypothetical protein